MSTRADDVKQGAQEALNNKKKIETYMQTLSDGSRRERQQAASVIAAMTKENPAKMSEFIGGILDALDCPAAKTRWAPLDALTALKNPFVRPVERRWHYLSERQKDSSASPQNDMVVYKTRNTGRNRDPAPTG